MMSYVLNFAPTGMVPTKSLNSSTPVSVSEIVEDVLMAGYHGASIAHLHARHAHTGEPVIDPDIYGSIIDGIRTYDKEIILCVSLSGRNIADPDQRAGPLALDGSVKPDMGSLTLSSLNFAKQASLNAPSTIRHLANILKRREIAPELEIFDLGMANYLKVLLKERLLPPIPYANILLGNISGAQPTFSHIAALLSNLPKELVISFAGIGDYQLQTTALALVTGYGIRIGLEDNIWFNRTEKKKATNAMLVQRVISIADIFGLRPKPPSVLRREIGLRPGNGAYGCAPYV